MSLPPGLMVDIASGFAQLIADADIGLTWRETGAYAAGETPIGVLRLPNVDGPAVAITPTLFPGSATLAPITGSVQFRSRAGSDDPYEAWTLAAAIDEALFGRFPTQLPSGLHVSSLVYTSGVSDGVDTRGRAMWVSNHSGVFTRR